jgi:hypothetical protein
MSAMSELDNPRKERLQILEKDVHEKLVLGRYRIGLALKEIRDNQLYMDEDFATFEAYLQQFAKNLGVDRRNLENLLRYADFRSALSNIHATGSEN